MIKYNIKLRTKTTASIKHHCKCKIKPDKSKITSAKKYLHNNNLNYNQNHHSLVSQFGYTYKNKKPRKINATLTDTIVHMKNTKKITIHNLTIEPKKPKRKTIITQSGTLQLFCHHVKLNTYE